jgi:hypothetical protein
MQTGPPFAKEIFPFEARLEGREKNFSALSQLAFAAALTVEAAIDRLGSVTFHDSLP